MAPTLVARTAWLLAALLCATPAWCATRGPGCVAARGSARIKLVADAAAPETALEAWLRDEHGVDTGRVRVGESSGRGRGVFARRGVDADEEIFAVPVDACITRRTIDTEPGELGRSLRTIVEQGGDGALVVATVAVVLKERALGARSRFAPFLESWPWRSTAESRWPVLLWSPPELELLRGTAAHDEAADLISEVGAACRLLWAVFRRLGVRVRLSECEGARAEALSGDGPTEAFCHAVRVACALVLSRSFDLGPGLGKAALVPLLDLCNSAEAVTAGHEFGLDAARDVVRLRARFGVPEGAEVEDHYGEHAAAMLLTYFGYVSPAAGLWLAVGLDAPAGGGAGGEAEASGAGDSVVDAAELRAWQLGVLERRGAAGVPRDELAADELPCDFDFDFLIEPPPARPHPELRALLRLAAVRTPDERAAVDAAGEGAWALLRGDADEAGGSLGSAAGPLDEPATRGMQLDALGETCAAPLGSGVERRAAAHLAAVCESALERYPDPPPTVPLPDADSGAGSAAGRPRASCVAVARALMEQEARALRTLAVQLRGSGQLNLSAAADSAAS